MFFAILVLISAFLIEGIGTFISTVGLSQIFASSPVIIVLAVALDLGKVVAVSFLYKHFTKINLLMKMYMTAAVIVLMLITSAGAYGFLSREFMHAVQGTNQNTIIINSLTDEQVKLQKRKEEIDQQIAKLPDNSVNGRRKLMSSFGPEIDRLNSRLEEIDKQLPQLKVESIQKNTEVGPIIYIAQSFNTDPEHAVKWVILIIIFVFDPLAVSLLLAGNFLIEQRKRPVPEPDPEIKLPKIPENFTQPEVQVNEKGQILAPKFQSHADLKEEMKAVARGDIPSPKDAHVDSFEPPHFVKIHHEPEQDLLDGIKEERYGYQRYKEKPVELFDHLTQADLGNKKPKDTREIIYLEQVMPRPRSKLENIDLNGNDISISQDEKNWLKSTRISDYLLDSPGNSIKG